MADVPQFSSKDLQVKSHLTQFRKEGGKIVESELESPNMTDDEGLDNLLAGVDEDEIEEGRANLYAENPALASAQTEDYLSAGVSEASARDGNEFFEPKRAAATKRQGTIMDVDSQTTLAFRRVRGSNEVELLHDSGEILETLSSKEFDELLDTGDYSVL